jgi:hypothetical protein
MCAASGNTFLPRHIAASEKTCISRRMCQGVRSGHFASPPTATALAMGMATAMATGTGTATGTAMAMAMAMATTMATVTVILARFHNGENRCVS